MPTFEGNLTAPAGRFAVVAARFNNFVVDNLVAGAVDTLKRHGVADDAIDVAWVPGSFEIPLVAQRLAASKNYVAVICLGAIIRGDTDHYDHVTSGATGGIAQASRATGIPVIFGVLTCDTLAQAIARPGGRACHKGARGALAAIESVNPL